MTTGHEFYTKTINGERAIFLLQKLPETSKISEILDFVRGNPSYCYDLTSILGEDLVLFYDPSEQDPVKEGGFFLTPEGEIEASPIPLALNPKINFPIYLGSFNKTASLIGGTSTALNERVIKEPPQETSNRQKTKTSKKRRKTSAYEVIRLDIDDDDDQMVFEVKTALNKGDYTAHQIQQKFGESDGYNLLYGLRTRKTMTLTFFHKWAEFLNKRVSIELKDNTD